MLFYGALPIAAVAVLSMKGGAGAGGRDSVRVRRPHNPASANQSQHEQAVERLGTLEEKLEGSIVGLHTLQDRMDRLERHFV